MVIASISAPIFVLCHGSHAGPPAYRRCAIAAIIRGITIGLSDNMRFLAEDFGRRGSSARSAMRGTPFGQPDLPTENGLFIARLSKMERSVCERSLVSGFDERRSEPMLDRHRSPWSRRIGKTRGRVGTRRAYAARSRDHRRTDFKHAFETDRPVRRNGFA